MQAACSHVDQIDPGLPPPARECGACVAIGSTWVHLRHCLVCGTTNCCDSSPNRHATAHFHETDHPIMQSLEPGEDWAWCFVDQVSLDQDAAASWHVTDPFFDAGLALARESIEAGDTMPFPPGTTTADGFPLAVWETTYRGRRRAGTLDPDQAAELEALPGWHW